MLSARSLNLFEDQRLKKHFTRQNFQCFWLLDAVHAGIGGVKVCWKLKMLNLKLATQPTECYRFHDAFSWFLASNLSTLPVPWPGNQFLPFTTWRFQGHGWCSVLLPFHCPSIHPRPAEAIVVSVRVRGCEHSYPSRRPCQSISKQHSWDFQLKTMASC